MRFILVEDAHSKDSVFIDTATGKMYTYKNGKFVELKNNKSKGGGKGSKGQPNDEPTSSSNQDDDTADSEQSDADNDENGSKYNGPQIGDFPEDDEILAAEEEERKRQTEKDPFAETEEERAERMAELKRLLDDDEFSDQLKDETNQKVFSSKQKRTEKERKKALQQYRSSEGLSGFPRSIEDFIKNELKASKVKTYSKLHKTYNANAGSPIMRQGRMKRKSSNKPRINVYYDQSPSWGPEDIVIGDKAMSVLKKYEDKDLITIDTYYFASSLGTTPNQDGHLGYGTSVEPVLNHIIETKPDNVVIMTDDDTSDEDGLPSVTVPGGVWFLWKEGLVSRNLQQHLKGKKITKNFSMTSTK